MNSIIIIFLAKLYEFYLWGQRPKLVYWALGPIW